MKKVFYPLACCCLAAGVFASCGGQKKANAPEEQNKVALSYSKSLKAPETDSLNPVSYTHLVRGKKNKESNIYKIGKFTFDTQKQILSSEGKQTKLTTKESELLGLLCAHANEILQRDFALKTIWIDDNYFNARSMDVYITKLRKHLKEDDSIEIINIHGKGYKLITPEVES